MFFPAAAAFLAYRSWSRVFLKTEIIAWTAEAVDNRAITVLFTCCLNIILLNVSPIDQSDGVLDNK